MRSLPKEEAPLSRPEFVPFPTDFFQKHFLQAEHVLIILGQGEEWAVSSQCSVTCGPGTKDLVRHCTLQSFESESDPVDCPGSDIRQDSCNHGECPGRKD